MPPKKGGTKRAAAAAADASAKKGRRTSEADVALRLGDELGEHTVVSLANIILAKIAEDCDGDAVNRMEVVKGYLCLFIALLTIAKMFNKILITGSTSSSSTKGSDDDDDDDDEDAARAAAPRPPSADFISALHDIANILIQLVQLIEINVFELLDTNTDFDFAANDAAGPQFALLKARVQAMSLKGKELLGRAASCVKQKDQRDEMLEIWIGFNEKLPIILMPPMLADEAQRSAAAAGGVMMHMTFVMVRNYFLSYKPESGARKHFFLDSRLSTHACLFSFSRRGRHRRAQQRNGEGGRHGTEEDDRRHRHAARREHPERFCCSVRAAREEDGKGGSPQQKD